MRVYKCGFDAVVKKLSLALCVADCGFEHFDYYCEIEDYKNKYICTDGLKPYMKANSVDKVHN